MQYHGNIASVMSFKVKCFKFVVSFDNHVKALCIVPTKNDESASV